MKKKWTLSSSHHFSHCRRCPTSIPCCNQTHWQFGSWCLKVQSSVLACQQVRLWILNGCKLPLCWGHLSRMVHQLQHLQGKRRNSIERILIFNGRNETKLLNPIPTRFFVLKKPRGGGHIVPPLQNPATLLRIHSSKVFLKACPKMNLVTQLWFPWKRRLAWLLVFRFLTGNPSPLVESQQK